jgi:hypothetical protein
MSIDRVLIETTAAGLGPGDLVTVEFEHDPAEVELILTPSPAQSASRWQQFAAAFADARSRRAPAPVTPAERPRRSSFTWLAFAVALMALR